MTIEDIRAKVAQLMESFDRQRKIDRAQIEALQYEVCRLTDKPPAPRSYFQCCGDVRWPDLEGAIRHERRTFPDERCDSPDHLIRVVVDGNEIGVVRIPGPALRRFA
jgi:hypothetical protein